MSQDSLSKLTSPINPEKTGEVQKKKRNRRKKSNKSSSTEATSASTTNVIESLTLPTQSNNQTVNNNNNNNNNNKSSQNQPSSEVTVVDASKNKKRRRRRKRPNTVPLTNDNITEVGIIKVENLLSKTFQDSRRNSIDNTKKLDQNQKHQLSLSIEFTVATKNISNNKNQNRTTENSSKMIKSKQIVRKSNEKVTKEQNELKKDVTTQKQPKSKVVGKVEEIKSVSVSSSSSTEKSHEEVLAQRKTKNLVKTSTKSRTIVIESTSKNYSKSINDSSKTNQSKFIKKDTTDTNMISKQKNENDIKKSIESISENKTTLVKSISAELPTSTTLINNVEKSREQILAEREAKKLAKQAAKNKNKENSITNKIKTEEKLPTEIKHKGNIQSSDKNDEIKKKSATTKAERRAIQEAQRQMKAKSIAGKQHLKKDIVDQQKPLVRPMTVPYETSFAPIKTYKFNYRVKLFNHLYNMEKENNLFVNNANIHPAIVRLGEQYIKRIVVGSNARCIAFLNALKIVVSEFDTPPKKEFGRVIEANIKMCIDYLHKCRPLAVSMINAHKYIKIFLTQLPSDLPECKLKEHLLQCIDDYIKDQIEKAAQAINAFVQEKISDGDVILTYGSSSLINHILEEAFHRNVSFRVICVDSRPFMEGQEMLRCLVSKGISCTCVLINAVGYIMPEVTKVLLGTHSILANGYVMSRAGTAQVALVARSYNVPVLVCCETHKFSERVQTDAIVYNEIGNPDDVVTFPLYRRQQKKHHDYNEQQQKENLKNWRTFCKLLPLNLNYDITPPELITAVVTEVAILPCTSVPVILRIKPNEICS